jgi:hypothetical protein
LEYSGTLNAIHTFKKSYDSVSREILFDSLTETRILLFIPYSFRKLKFWLGYGIGNLKDEVGPIFLKEMRGDLT